VGFPIHNRYKLSNLIYEFMITIQYIILASTFPTQSGDYTGTENSFVERWPNIMKGGGGKMRCENQEQVEAVWWREGARKRYDVT